MENWTTVLVYGTAISLLVFVGSLVVAWLLIIRLPADYLTRPVKRTTENQLHPALHLTWRVVRNLIGLVLLVVGLIMLVTPGQGLLFIFLGLVFLDFPGKHRLLHRLLSQPRIYRSINSIRSRSGQPPIELPSHETDP